MERRAKLQETFNYFLRGHGVLDEYYRRMKETLSEKEQKELFEVDNPCTWIESAFSWGEGIEPFEKSLQDIRKWFKLHTLWLTEVYNFPKKHMEQLFDQYGTPLRVGQKVAVSQKNHIVVGKITDIWIRDDSDVLVFVDATYPAGTVQPIVCTYRRDEKHMCEILALD